MTTAQIPVHAVLLAAGSSSRFGAENKLLAQVDGQPLVARTASRLLATNVSVVVAVVAAGADGEAVAAALNGYPVQIAVNPHASRGIGASIACGASALADTSAGIMIIPGDMPSLDPVLLNRLIAGFQADRGDKIVHPVTQAGEQRNPVIWPAWARPELLQLDDAKGGKKLLAQHLARTLALAASHDGVFEDIDTREDLERFANREA